MRARSGDSGFVVVTEALHRLTVAAVLGRFLVGHGMDLGDAVGRWQDRPDAQPPDDWRST